MVLSAVDGETIARKILRDDEFAEAQRLLPGQLGVALARIHRTDTSTLGGLTSDDQIAMYRTVLDTSGHPHPTFELAFRWLERNRPPLQRPTLVHGDFRLGNLMIGTWRSGRRW